MTHIQILGGGNSKKIIFNPEPWGFMMQFDEHIFQNRLVQPPTRVVIMYISPSFTKFSASKCMHGTQTVGCLSLGDDLLDILPF